MKYLIIDEEKWATIILLEKIKDMHVFERQNSKNFTNSFHVNEFVTLNGINYKINHSIFVRLFKDFESQKLIKINDSMPLSIIEIIKNPIDYANEELKRNNVFRYEDLDNDNITQFWIILKSLDKINKKIRTLNTAGASLKELASAFDFNKNNLKVDKIKLSSMRIIFNNDEAKIVIGAKEIKLPLFKKEYSLCHIMFKNHKKAEFVDWSKVFEEIDGSEAVIPSKKDRRALQDTMYRVNNRIKENITTDDALFTWKDNSLARNY